jgi:tetratricopeptide (TPR) repeat protein
MSENEKIRQELIDSFLKRYMFINKDKEAIVFFEELFNKASSHGITDLSLLFEGYRDFWKKDYKAALQKFLETIESNKSIAYTWNGLGIVYIKLKEYSKAEEAYRKAILCRF